MSNGLKISRARARQYQWGHGVNAWHLLNQAGLSVIEEIMPPGAGDSAHWHTQARQFFFVLEGSLQLQVAEHEVDLQEGEGLHVAPGQVHQARNTSAEPVRFLVVSAPHSHGDRVEAEGDGGGAN